MKMAFHSAQLGATPRKHSHSMMKHAICIMPFWGEIMDLHPVGKKKTTHEIVEGKREAPGNKLREANTLVGAWFGAYLLGRWSADSQLVLGW